MQHRYFHSDSDDVEEKVIHKISPDSSSHYKPECPCGCHHLADCSEKSFAIIPFRQNGSTIEVLKLPIFKIKKQPKKTLVGYARCRVVPFGQKGLQHHFPLPMWSVRESEMAACLTCKEGKEEIRQQDRQEERHYTRRESQDDRQQEKQDNNQEERQQDLHVKSDMSSQTDPVIMKERSSTMKSEIQLQNTEPSTSWRHSSSVKDTVPEEPEDEIGRYSYEDYRTGFGQWYPFFINKPSKRWRRD